MDHVCVYQEGSGGSKCVSQQEILMRFDRTTKNSSFGGVEEKRLMKSSAADLLLVNVDKLFSVASLIGLLDLPFKHIRLFSHTFTSASGPSC